MPEETLRDKESFYRKMETLLAMGPGSVQGRQELTMLKSWDSLTILEFMVMVDNDYKSDVQPADIAACKTVDSLAELIFTNSSLTP